MTNFNRGRNCILKKTQSAGWFILLFFIAGCSTSYHLPGKALLSDHSPVYITKIQTDSLFNSHQTIFLLALRKNLLNDYSIDIGYNKTDLVKTSQIAKKNHAVAAINGSFFDEDNGGSVTYFEKNDTVINKIVPPGIKWAIPDSLITGVIILTKNNKLKIGPAKPESFYERSKKEAFALINGPLLLYHKKPQNLPNMKFASHRHPRSCLCITKKAILFVVIDGRQPHADGMTLYDVQKFLLSLGCIDAINLDGGGSSTLWTKETGVVNKPSDKTGERTVANALLILKKH